MNDITTEERLRLLLDNAQDCVYRARLVPGLAFEYVSPGIEALAGRPAADFYADPLLPLKLVHPDDRDALRAALAGDDDADLFRYVHEDGRIVWVETRGRVVRDAEGRAVAIEGFGRDVTERVRAQALFEAAFKQAPVGMGLTSLDPDDADCLVEVNDALCAFLGRSREELLDSRMDELTHPEDRGKAIELKRRVFAGELDHFCLEKRYLRPDGAVVWGLLRGTLVRDPDGRPLHGLVQVSDITERRAFEDQLAHRALHDGLTGLPNRLLFLDRLQRALAVRPRDAAERVAVLYVDLDDLKAINDTLGHAAGDVLLREAAQRLQTAVRPGDTVARIAGDEFTVLCAEVPGTQATAALAERLLAAVREPLALGDEELEPTISVGYAERRAGPGASHDELLADAELALVHAQELGGARVQPFDERLRRRSLQRRHTEAELRRAHARGELRLHYQPIVDLETRQPVALEALLRWQHPVRGMLLPGEFIAVAERTGAIVDIGRWVVEQACRDLARLPRVGHICVNLSARQLADHGLTAAVEAALGASGADAGALCFEVTETALVADPARAAAALAALRGLGARVAVDDFGTGYSSLAQLKTLPVDVLKIDRLFVQAVGEDERDAAVVAAVVTMAHALGLDLVAEGVETEAQRERLMALGCPRGQGFLFARPEAPAGMVGAPAPGATPPH